MLFKNLKNILIITIGSFSMVWASQDQQLIDHLRIRENTKMKVAQLELHHSVKRMNASAAKCKLATEELRLAAQEFKVASDKLIQELNEQNKRDKYLTIGICTTTLLLGTALWYDWYKSK